MCNKSSRLRHRLSHRTRQARYVLDISPSTDKKLTVHPTSRSELPCDLTLDILFPVSVVDGKEIPTAELYQGSDLLYPSHFGGTNCKLSTWSR